MKATDVSSSLRHWLGIERNTTTHAEKWISGIGAFLGIAAVYAVIHQVFPQGLAGAGPAGAIMLASLGASAVLLFAVPHGALSQPWAVVGGHLISAAIGVSCQKLFPGHAWTPALAVGVAVGAMHYLRCIHPPGGATSLAAVIGSEDLHALGYHYLLEPVGVSVAAILLVAIVFNAPFPWRRYPLHLHRRRQAAADVPAAQRHFELTQEDFSAAMAGLNSYVDIPEESLTELLELAKQHAERSPVHPQVLSPGHCYSNGRLGREWSVREIVARSGAREVDYRVVAGEGLGQAGRCGEEAFRQWARFVVTLRDGRWVR
ncbi:HPP domain-containing protein [Stenotrophomonas panacihumi]|uniref:HPP domain-containing protein n=1 Tax=Stenotrophomonas panacihumi TaxID=676599 RepID=A0A0R0AEI7_9GAMM|nr:HPP family protein [Stenotrophomonas panacihumi]KRG43245.1 HPP domain-containing protein [Stenotrophomonas panacihumi]PTN55703.1 HPP family protein [Stenotrophomonas panacihumi]